MTTEAELQKAVAAAEKELAAKRSVLQANEQTLVPLKQETYAASTKLERARAALEKFRRDNVKIEEFEVFETEPSRFFCVQYTGPEMISSLDLWLRRLTGGDSYAHSAAGSFSKRASVSYEDAAWVGMGDHREIVRPGYYIVVKPDAYPTHVDVFKTDAEFSLYYQKEKP